MTAGDGCAWLDAWTSRWRQATYPPPSAGDTVQDYLSRAGREPLDEAIAALCDRYLAAGPEVQAAFRVRLGDERAMRATLLAYVFRAASALRREPAPLTLRRALAAAAIEDARLDARDLIVGLLVLRWAAQQVGMEPAVDFAAVAATAGQSTGALIAGIPRRSESEMESTVRQMTATAWRQAFAARPGTAR